MTLNITESEATRLIAMYFREFPLIETYVKDAHNMAIWNHYVMNTFGQSKQEFGAMGLFRKTAVYNAAQRNAQNVRVQSTASSAGLFAFTRVNNAVKPMGALALCTVYDSLELQVPIPRAAEVVESVFYHMEEGLVKEFEWLDLPIAVDLELGSNWSHMVKIKRGTTQQGIRDLILDKLGFDMDLAA